MKYTVVIFLVLGLFITACGTDTAPANKGVFIGGTTGVVASFEPFSILENNIYTVFDNEDFPMDVVVKNKGEENINPGDITLRLLGPSKEQFENIPSWELQNKQTIEKISEFNPNGGEEVVSFTPNQRAIFKGEITGFMDINWNLESQYKYKTQVVVDDVCFKGDVTDLRICNVQEAKTFSVSGAPITVASVEQDTAGKGVIVLKMKVRNAGTGTSTIPGKEFDNRFSQIGFSIDESDKWECKSSGRENEARLTDGVADVICRLKTPLAEDELFVKTVKLSLEYVYKELTQTALRVKESAR